MPDLSTKLHNEADKISEGLEGNMKNLITLAIFRGAKIAEEHILPTIDENPWQK